MIIINSTLKELVWIMNMRGQQPAGNATCLISDMLRESKFNDLSYCLFAYSFFYGIQGSSLVSQE